MEQVSMPRKAEETEGGKVHEDLTAKPGAGGKLKKFVKAIEKEQAAIDTKVAETKELCEPHRQEIARQKKLAAEAGFPKTELSLLIKKRRLENTLENITDTLDDDQKDTFDNMV